MSFKGNGSYGRLGREKRCDMAGVFTFMKYGNTTSRAAE
jgi:hypothetical protein